MLRRLEELFNSVPTKVVYCYGEYQKEFDELPPNVELIEGFPNNLSDMVRGHDNSLIVLDDLMSQCSNDQRAADLFMHGLHHCGISVLYLTQNIFPPDKLSRTSNVSCLRLPPIPVSYRIPTFPLRCSNCVSDTPFFSTVD